MAKENQTFLNKYGLNEQVYDKLVPEKDLHKGHGGGKASKRDLKALIKTMWAMSGTIEKLIAALEAANDKLEDLINRQ